MAIGAIISFTGSTVPDRYLVCDGSAISRETYSALFAVIGTSYGAGDGSTTFNLPNMTGRAVLGAASGYNVGSTGGAETVTLTESTIPSHTHVIPEHGHTNTIAAKTPSLSHTITQAVFKYTGLTTNVSNRYGSGTSKSAYYNRTSAAMSKSANLAVANHSATACTMSGSVTDCAAFDSETTGGDGAHNNMMPFMALTWIIEAEPDVPPVPKMYLFNGALPVSAGGAYICGKA